MEQVDLVKYRDYLNYLADGGYPCDAKYGVCFQFNEKFKVYLIYEIPRYYDIIQDFEYYSGDIYYPIKGENSNPEYEFDFTHNLWTAEYGRRRRLFCKFLADYLHKIINDNTITGDK